MPASWSDAARPAGPNTASGGGDETMSNKDADRVAGETLAANTVRLREARGWTTNDLANAAGIAIDEMIAFERAEKSPTLEDMRRIAMALVVPLSELFADC